MSRIRIPWMVKLCIVVPFMFTSSCKQATQEVAPPPEVKVIEVIQKDFPLVREFVGQTYGLADIAIRARVEGFLEGILFEEGRTVKKGQLLIPLTHNPFLPKRLKRSAGLQRQRPSWSKRRVT